MRALGFCEPGADNGNVHSRFVVVLVLASLLVLGAAGCVRAGSSDRKILFLSDRDGGWALYTTGTDGGGANRVLPGGRADPSGEGWGFGEPVVSPDGRKVLLAREGITVATLATGASKRIGPGEEAGAAWSPDSARVAFSGPQAEGLYVADVRTGRTHYLDSTSQVWTPAWSPDGSWIVFAGQDGDGPTETYAVHPNGTGLRAVSPYAPQSPGGYSWSRGGKLAFVDSRLVVVVERTWRDHVLQPRLGDGSVAWSPDGHTLAYAVTTDRAGSSELFTIGADGRDRRRLTPTWPPASESSPVWSPDGKTLLFVRTPSGGGAARELPQVWTMRADGSQRRPLTTAYPDGGDNLEPAWISGPLHTDPTPRPQETRAGGTAVLRVPFPIDGIAADGREAAIAPLGFETESEYRPTPPVLLWRPGRREPTHVVASSCGGVSQLALAGSRLAFDCDHQFFDESLQSMWVVDVKTRIPREVFVGHGMFFGAGGPGPQGIFLDSIVGGNGLLAFGSETDSPRHGRRLTLWRVDGFFGVAIRSVPDVGNVVAAGGGRLAVELANGNVAMLTRDGVPVRVLQLSRARGQPQAFLLADRKLVLLTGRALQAYDTTTGKLAWRRRVPAGARLQAADGRVVVYSVGTVIHVLSSGHETVVHTGATALRSLRGFTSGLVHAALTPNGLYYCFDVAASRYPGRVVFLPRAAL